MEIDGKMGFDHQQVVKEEVQGHFELLGDTGPPTPRLVVHNQAENYDPSRP